MVKKVSIIDDDKLTVFLTCKAITYVDNSIELETFYDAASALNNFKNTDNLPDLILLDINMPEMDGWAFLNNFSLLPKTCNVVIISSSINPDDFDKAKTYKIVKGFISKPISKDKLMRILT